MVARSKEQNTTTSVSFHKDNLLIIFRLFQVSTNINIFTASLFHNDDYYRATQRIELAERQSWRFAFLLQL